MALESIVNLVEEIASASGIVRSASDQVLKSLDQDRALSA
jgi:hypothetical protein